MSFVERSSRGFSAIIKPSVSSKVPHSGRWSPRSCHYNRIRCYRLDKPSGVEFLAPSTRIKWQLRWSWQPRNPISQFHSTDGQVRTKFRFSRLPHTSLTKKTTYVWLWSAKGSPIQPSGNMPCNNLMTVLEEYSILDKIGYFMSDNAPAVTAATEEISRQLIRFD